ncbi:carbohydrate ABC transporter permease [Paenibacillus roseipurpureus]|uniref:Carbohydrate ABC transporter permease n=1 Tax=Paenibacillus roseopurpureus TaxID=2918901 RepID=A0AA96RM53_9BACL|nr:carbohydrate ABC transporter permease [Paenibacillus sp. MBLB1832]WNR46099.1 carbohydrate ABC transporter permease [Paenibacillus sp. MBLB1832]
MNIRLTSGERAFDILNILLLTLISVIAMVPIMHVVAGSFSSPQAIIHNRVSLWPVEPTLENFRIVVQTDYFWKACWMTVKVVAIGTVINMVLTVFGSYPLSKMHLRGRRLILLFIVFTMVFQAPLIPIYLVVKNLGLLNSMWSLIIPSAISAFNMMLCLTFFRSVPEELFDAAKVDGMGEFRIVWQIVIPLSKPILVTLLLFYAVGHWNNYMAPLLYITDKNLQTLQMYIYSLIAMGNSNDMAVAAASEAGIKLLPEALEMATIVLATTPIVILYPFLQKHFIKGATLGSVKE